MEEIQPLYLARPFISSSNKRRKPAKYQSTSLGDAPVTIGVTTVTDSYFRSFFQLFPKLQLLLGEVNDGPLIGVARGATVAFAPLFSKIYHRFITSYYRTLL